MFSYSTADNYQSMFTLATNNYHNHHQPPVCFGIDVAKIDESPDMTPLRNSPDDLYQQFIEIQEKYIQNQQQQQRQQKRAPEQHIVDKDDEDNVFELAHEFECLTNAHLQVLINLRAKRSLAEDDALICKKLEVMLKEERNTWRLAKALFKDQLLDESREASRGSDRMDDSGGNHDISHDEQMVVMHPNFSEEQIIGNFYVMNSEIRRMQLVTDWLEANEASDLDYKDEEDKVEFYSEGPTAWENTFHAMRARYNINIPDLDITVNPNAGLELCSAMDPDAPIRTKKSLVHTDKEVEIRLFKHLFRFLRAGKLDEGQELAQRVGYHWLSAILDGWLPYSDPNLDEENLGTTAIHQPSEIRPVSGNKKRDIWKQTCFRSARMHGLNSCEKAILGVLGGNLKSVLPVCNSWSDQLWARLKCSIDVKIEKALRDPNIVPQENRNLTDYPQEFYENYQSLRSIFKSIKELKIVSPFKEATIHQTVQKYFILNDINGLLNQLEDWCHNLEYDNNLAENNEAISPQFLRCFAHIILFLREINLVTADDARGTKIIEAYISLLTQQKSIESVAHYTVFLPRDNQIVSYAKLLATINDREERKHCLKIAKESQLDVDEITQTVVEIIREESVVANPQANVSASDIESTKTTASDRRKIDALDYMLYLETKNHLAILHHGNILLRYFAIQKKMDAVKETFLKLPPDLSESVENQWRLHTNGDITLKLRNSLRELEGFRAVLEAHEALSQWSEWHHKKPEEPKKPANLSKFCDNVNYEQRLKQFQQDISLWKELRELRTNALTQKITELFYFPGGWMKDLPTNEDGASSDTDRLQQLGKLRKIFIPQMTTICFNVLQLTNRYEECLKISHLLVRDDLKLYEEFTKVQLRDFLDKISEVTKIIVKKSTSES